MHVGRGSTWKGAPAEVSEGHHQSSHVPQPHPRPSWGPSAMIPFRVNQSSRSLLGVGTGTVCMEDRQRPLRPQERPSSSERRGTSPWRRRGRCGSSFDGWAGPRAWLPSAPRFPAALRNQRPHRPGSKPGWLEKPVPPNLPHGQRPPGVRGCGGGAFNGLQDSYWSEDFPGGPVAETLHFQCGGPRLDPWSGN